jgi:MOSC domain-containing protein YiiM
MLRGSEVLSEQIEHFRIGLASAVVSHDQNGTTNVKTCVMGVVVKGGTVEAGDVIDTEPPSEPHIPLEII